VRDKYYPILIKKRERERERGGVDGKAKSHVPRAMRRGGVIHKISKYTGAVDRAERIFDGARIFVSSLLLCNCQLDSVSNVSARIEKERERTLIFFRLCPDEHNGGALAARRAWILRSVR